MDRVSRQLLRTCCLMFICQGLSAVVSGECPADAEQRMTMCTKPLSQFGNNNNNNNNNNKEALSKYCRALKEVPACLEDILHQCQGDMGLDSIEDLKKTTNQLKATFDKKCEPICARDPEAISSSPMTTWHQWTLILSGVFSSGILARL